MERTTTTARYRPKARDAVFEQLYKDGIVINDAFYQQYNDLIIERSVFHVDQMAFIDIRDRYEVHGAQQLAGRQGALVLFTDNPSVCGARLVSF